MVLILNPIVLLKVMLTHLHALFCALLVMLHNTITHKWMYPIIFGLESYAQTL